MFFTNPDHLSVVPSPGVRVTVGESLNRELNMVSEWCDLWRMKLNASKTKSKSLWGFVFASFGVLICSVVLGCRYTPLLDSVVCGA